MGDLAKQFGEVRIGISGWRYEPWRGVFYPKALPQRRELEYAAGIFGSVEVNGTFHSLQHPASFAHWADATPDDFVFPVKGSRFITDMLRLTKIRKALANFFASGILKLGRKLGHSVRFLLQFSFDPERIEAFFSACCAAMRLPWFAPMPPDAATPTRTEPARVGDPGSVSWPRLMDLTADFVYCRLHGSEEPYASGYDGKSLDEWAARAAAWARGSDAPNAELASREQAPRRAKRDVFVYFDNDAKVRAPVDAQGLIERVANLLREPLLRPPANRPFSNLILRPSVPGRLYPELTPLSYLTFVQ